jgi:copper(I)-binding protein
MKTRRVLLGAVALLSLSLAACGDDDNATTETTAATGSEIAVANAWARTSPAGTTLGAAYMDITSSAADTLVGVSVPADIAKVAEIHEMAMADDTGHSSMAGGMTETSMAGGMTETTMAGGMSETTMAGGEMVMREVDKIDLPAGTTVQLKPGGYHIMLIDLAAPLTLDQTFDVTLTFGSGATKTVTVTVRDTAP